MKIPDHILEDRRFSAWQRIILGIIATYSLNGGGCHAKNSYFIKTYGMDKNTVSKAIEKFEEMELVRISGTDKEREMQYAWEKFPQELSRNLKGKRGKIHQDWVKNSPRLGEKFTDSSEKFTQQRGKIHEDGGKIHPAYNGKEIEEIEKEIESKPTTTGFSILKNNQDELVGFLLSKFRRRLIELLPKGSAEEIANDFAKWWVAQGRDFTNTPRQRIWVENSLPQWAEIEKPKNATSDIKAIASEVWRRDFPDSELKLINEKVIQENWSEDELRAFMFYTKRNIPVHGTNTWNVFKTHFEKLKLQVA